MIICPKCNKELEDGTQVCDACGEILSAPEAAPEAAKPAFNVKKLAVIGVAAVAVIILAIFIGSLIFGGGSPDYALYIKDGEMVFANNFKKPYEVTDELADGVENSQLASMADQLGYYTYLTDDGKKLFYIDDGDDLYYRDATNAKAEAKKLASGISGRFMVNEKGNIVTYIKDGSLYQHDLKDQTKIKGDVDGFIASLDGKKIIFSISDAEEKQDLYLKNGKKDAEKIASNIEDVLYVNKSFSKIYVLKEDAVYLKDGSKDLAKICSDVESVIKFYEDGTFYYVEKEEEKAEDAEMPTETSDIIDRLVEEATDTLCFFNGKEKKVITTQYYNGGRSVCYDKEILAYCAVNRSEITDKDYEDGLYGLDEFTEWYIAIEDKAAKIDLDDIYGVRIARNGKVAYVWTVEKEEEKDDGVDEADEAPAEKEPTATLYKIKLSDSVGKAEKFDEEVYPSSIGVTSAGNVIYYKDVKDGKGDLYVDKVKIDTDVALSSYAYLKDSKKILYFCDMDEKGEKGTLKIATLKGKSTKVGDDVYDYEITPNEDILFLKDYKNYKGELHLFTGSKAKKLDDDVVGIIGYTSYTKSVAAQYGWIKD